MKITTEQFTKKKQLNSKDFYSAIKIYKEAFEKIERDSVKNIKKQILNDYTLFFLIYKINSNNDKNVIGFYTLVKNTKNRTLFLAYFGIDKSFRNLGFGSYILKNMLRTFYNDSEVDYFFLEAQNRQSLLYNRFDFQIIEKDYFEPSFENDDDVLKTNLMVNSKINKSKINGKDLNDFLIELFFEDYKLCKNDIRALNQIKSMKKKYSLNKDNHYNYR